MNRMCKKGSGLIPFLVMVFFTALPQSMGYAGGLEKKAQKILAPLVPGQGQLEFNHQSFTIPVEVRAGIEDAVEQEFLNDNVDLWTINREGQLAAYAFMDDVLGKNSPITFAVLFDLEGTVIAVRVIKYRERYGSGVRNKRWLKQFMNKNASSSFRLGTDIDAISGATISSASVTKGIEKLTRLMAHFVAQRSNQ